MNILQSSLFLFWRLHSASQSKHTCAKSSNNIDMFTFCAHRLLFIEINPEEYHLASYFGLRRAILPQVNLLFAKMR